MSNPFTAAGSELGRSMLPILKLTRSGQWVCGAENTPMIETRFVADVQGAQRGFICFVGRKVVDEIVSPLSGKKISADELPDHGPYEEGDGWRQIVSIRLRSIETGDEFVFKPTSQGGLSAIGDLLTKYGNRLDIGLAGVPIVELSVTRYEHQRYGTVPKPLLRIVGWKKEADFANDTVVKLAEELHDDEIPF